MSADASMRALFASLLAVALLATAPASVAQGGARPVVIVVPFSGGGPTDTVARILAPALARELGVAVTVDNASGGGGTVGTARAAKGAADGSVLLLHHLGHVTAPSLYAKLGFDPLTDFVGVGRVADVPMTLVARSNLPPKDAKELLGWIRGQGRKLNVGHAGIGAASHLCALLLMRALGTPLTEVAYKGTGPAMTDLLSGQLDLMCDQTTNTLPQVRSGRIKAYAVTTAARLPVLKDTPTLAEAGLKNFEVTVWHGLYAPRGTPPDTVARTAKALQEALRDAGVVQRLGELGAIPARADQATPAALQAWSKSESARWTQVLKSAGVRPEQ
jgi:tripartite-type tricarboxylate transporter receptor subunit TctC